MDITNEIVRSFRDDQSYFCSQINWPADILKDALCEADAETGGRGWGVFEDVCGNFKRRGMFAYAAHSLITEFPKGAKVGESSPSATAVWAVQGKSVGDESVTFNTGDTSKMSPGDAWLASTRYGQRFLRLRKRAGMGAMAV